jgi:hypothetical protein
MATLSQPDEPDRIETSECEPSLLSSSKILALARRAVCEALWRHKRLKQSIAVMRGDQVVILPPEEIPVEDDRPEWKPWIPE